MKVTEKQLDAAEALVGKCSCHESYSKRGLRDPACDWCQFGVETAEAIAAAYARGLEDAAKEIERIAVAARENDKEWRDWQWALRGERGAAPKDGTTHFAAKFAAAIRALGEDA